jgi:hypothetical protein
MFGMNHVTGQSHKRWMFVKETIGCSEWKYRDVRNAIWPMSVCMYGRHTNRLSMTQPRLSLYLSIAQYCMTKNRRLDKHKHWHTLKYRSFFDHVKVLYLLHIITLYHQNRLYHPLLPSQISLSVLSPLQWAKWIWIMLLSHHNSIKKVFS